MDTLEGTLLKNIFLVEINKDKSILRNAPGELGSMLFERCKKRIMSQLPNVEFSSEDIRNIGMWSLRCYMEKLE
jgi:hypothetical protein